MLVHGAGEGIRDAKLTVSFPDRREGALASVFSCEVSVQTGVHARVHSYAGRGRFQWMDESKAIFALNRGSIAHSALIEDEQSKPNCNRHQSTCLSMEASLTYMPGPVNV